ncbi:CHRD domain-containing protein [Natribacillus halophilus]|uniref:CHRD domain-containing protein n=1 Tax=Natribacillus halophilus TaxID=549003 RepID=A0A1G8KX42_9BACI|nr:CHRD domain-containing protein [Natribacillus halophilus]SDI47917.1 CHRD domain-containing protein [Natribacillus halophilus]
MKKALVTPLAGLFAFSTFAVTASADHEGREFLVEMTPDQEVHEVESYATGEAHFEVSEDGETLEYSVHAWDLEDAVEGHLHSGAVGEDGPVELFLFENDEPMDYDGEVATGTLTEEDLVGDMTWEEFSMGLVAGEVYVNLHTEENPDGEIRGQLDGDAEEAAMMPDEMPQTGMGGTSNDGWFKNLWNSITSFLFN